MKYAIGIDPGVQTGFALWSIEEKKFLHIETLLIHNALNRILLFNAEEVIIVVEDARLRKWFGNDKAKNEAKKQNVGSVKRDCKIWEDFLKDKGYKFKLTKPKNTKIATPIFNKIANYHKRTSNHARDAAMLVINMK